MRKNKIENIYEEEEDEISGEDDLFSNSDDSQIIFTDSDESEDENDAGGYTIIDFPEKEKLKNDSQNEDSLLKMHAVDKEYVDNFNNQILNLKDKKLTGFVDDSNVFEVKKKQLNGSINKSFRSNSVSDSDVDSVRKSVKKNTYKKTKKVDEKKRKSHEIAQFEDLRKSLTPSTHKRTKTFAANNRIKEKKSLEIRENENSINNINAKDSL